MNPDKTTIRIAIAKKVTPQPLPDSDESYTLTVDANELTAVERFKREFPEAAVPLQAPTGAALQQVRRTSPKVLAALGVLILAVVGWNVFQRVVRIEPPHPSDLVAVPKDWAKAADAEVDKALYLGAPRAGILGA